MSSRTVHFVYAVPPTETVIAKSDRLVRRSLQRCGIPVPLFPARQGVETSNWPDRAPFTITATLYAELGRRWPTLLYDWRERVRIRPGPDDVLIGHPHPHIENSAWNLACREGSFARKIALAPFSHGLPQLCSYFEPYVDRVDRILAITGPYWWDTWADGPFRRWMSKLRPVDMAVDVSRFPRVKRTFQPPGRRVFFYVGWSGVPKGTHLLGELFGRVRDRHRCVWFGDGPRIPNVEARPFTRFDGVRLAALADECDLFLTMGVSDANPTTILEAMAWGFPVACTPQSGYFRTPPILELDRDDMARNERLLDWLQWAPEEELRELSERGRKLVEDHFTWERFVGTVLEELAEG